MKRKVIAIVLIILGIGIIAYPKANEYYSDYKQSKLLEEWEKAMREVEVEKVAEDDKNDKGDQEPKEKMERVEGGLEGVLKIDKIDLKLPILTGVSHENMKTSVASFEYTAGPGELGNYAISGHRNLTYGRNFNRLDEINLGDKLQVDTEKNDYEYEVVEKLYVTPDETWVLDGNDSEKEITLVTCHPTGVATHRLIIKGKVIE